MDINDVVVSSDTSNGRLVQVTTKVTTDKEEEAYQKMIDMDYTGCPKCGEKLRPRRSDMHIVIYNPLSDLFGMNLGSMVTKCQCCGEEITLMANVDLGSIPQPFPTTTLFLNSLRAEYKKRAAAARNKGLTPKKGTK